MNYWIGSVLAFILCISLCGLAGAIDRAEMHPAVYLEKPESQVEYEKAYDALKERVEELKVEKKSAVTRKEKKQVKAKMKKTKKEIKELRSKPVSGGIYIGSGALLILLILLILL